MRRRQGSLLDIEIRLLMTFVDVAGADLAGVDVSAGSTSGVELHGFALAKLLGDHSGSKRLTSHGTLYKALARLEAAGLVTSRWEDVDEHAPIGRPRRRLYRITAEGRATAIARASHPTPTDPLRPGVAWS